MAGRGLLPLLLLMLFVIVIEATSSSPSNLPTRTHGEAKPRSRSTPVHSGTGGTAQQNHNTHAEEPDVSDFPSVGDRDEDGDPRNDCRTTESCKDGDPGLPRLGSQPHVTNIATKSATICFHRWRKDRDHGEQPCGSQLSYVVRLWKDENWRLPAETEISEEQCDNNKNYCYYPLPGLIPNMTYRVQTLVKVEVDGKICMADGAEVKNSTFTTCPVPPMPKGLSEINCSSNRCLVNWTVVGYPQQCHLQYLLRVFKKRGLREFEVNQSKVMQVPHMIAQLQAYTEYNVAVRSGGGGDYSAETKITVKTRPAKPGIVSNLRVVGANGTSVLVTWDDPKDYPRKGELKSFRVSWGLPGVTSGRGQRDVGLQKEFVIEDLSPNTTYTIKVQGKNKDVEQFGDPLCITTTTSVGVPSPVQKFKTLNATVSLLIVSWQEPKSVTGIINVYNASLRPASATSPQRNKSVTTTQAEFDGLEAGTQYRARIEACNNEHCSIAVEKSVWTRPNPPLLKESVDLRETTDTTVTIQLPRLANPPGWHYVVVQREGTHMQTTDVEVLKTRAVALIVSEEQKDPPRTKRSADLTGTGSEMYVAAKVKQEGDERLQVTVGDGKTYEGRYHNHPLKEGAAYWTLAVTETKSGPWAERLYSEPRRFVAAPSTPTFEGLVLAAGMAVVMVLVAVLAIVCIKRRHRLREIVFRDHIKNDSPVPASRPEPFFIHFEHHNNGKKRGPPMGKELMRNPCYPDHASQDPPKEDIYANMTLQVLPEALEAYLLRSVMSAETKEEFARVPFLMSNNVSASNLPENRSKNRYRTNVTYDETRVVLPLYDNISRTDYINANFIEGPRRPNAFIATQGPKDTTVGAFWRMVWHTQCPAIVMVANTTERGKVKVWQYWPESQPLFAEGVTVIPGDIIKMMDFVIRKFSLSVGSIHRQVTHYQYIAWPDHGVPEMAYGLAHMLKILCRNHSSCLPVTVHCSAGIGRTGTVLLALYLLEQMKTQGVVNMMDALSVLRRGRGRLVENTEQYVFAHQVLYEMLFGMDTAFPCHSFGEQLSALRSPQLPEGVSPLQRQFKKLKSLPKDMSFKYGKDPAVAHLNRNKDILPADCRILFVPSMSYELESRYLNVVRINGADMKDAYVAGEHPQKHTLAKMWKLVHEREIGAWLMVHNFPPDYQKFPRVVCDSSALQDNITLKASELRSLDHYDEQEVTVGLRSLGEVSKHKCVLLTLKGWPADSNLPTSPEPLLSLIERAVAIPAYQQILITCRDGVAGCGLVAALLVALGRTKLAREVDIYRAAASVMNDRPQFIVDQDQYEFLHLVMDTFLSNERHYNYN